MIYCLLMIVVYKCITEIIFLSNPTLTYIVILVNKWTQLYVMADGPYVHARIYIRSYT